MTTHSTTGDGAEPGAAFWRFSLSVYGQEGVPDICLALQDAHGVDVNMLLYLLFRATGGVALDAGEIARLDAALAPWRDAVVRPLRGVRRALKAEALARIAADDDRLRQRIKSAELEAERLQQMALARLGAEMAGTAQAPGAARGAAWRAYGAHLGADLPEAALARLARAIGAARPDGAEA
ncbi:TIGR02444 family protein [Rhodovulum sp. 12E13]|uniref:TIGR02444 family protein n=1 Tax=Rhodovulum sp. 12E13 TaxID=2203891 RepID=UPI000E1699C0|nr:TIGR02444 family protein [Rhodovulum sp. 12E13]RDC71968.1 TIGR02444 family protein [Rhodovulum sp. 12E13]